MPKITFIGAGSTVFAKNLIGDILSFPELAESELVLYDIDAERLATSEIVARKVAQALSAKPRIVVTTDRERALDGAHYAINMIQVGGYKPATVIDFEIPKKYGLRQTIADTLGIGGIMRAVRTIPVLLEMSRDMERLCPEVLHLNYVNPMAMIMWALQKASPIRSIGLCHSVQHTAGEICRDIGVPVEEVNYLVAGINHMAYFLRLEHQGQDLYPRLRTFAESGQTPYRDHGEVQLPDRVRYEMFKRLGYFVTESSEHHAEYLPYFIKRDRPDLIERYGIPLDEYVRRCEAQIAGWETQRQELLSERAPLEVRRSVEYGSGIIHSLETGQPRVVYGNVLNHGLIDNLPQGCCVEVPCLVDKNGIQPTKIGVLPPQLAALMRTNINVQELTVEAILTGKREHLYHAAMLDPHTAAELDLEQIWKLVDELLEAHGEFIPVNLRSYAAAF
ncbi:MAG: alpha-glucosidase/alpha-galactosidase [Meiothermus sp.]|uniref:alpha-glucosidase/alpha-galactosidase n=1 Tax=Meiothermus sp. TaxID=1955249 RepID=UPI0025D59CFC|nr:alpha-glucosidase/alpha-galactosidase [Meiothermus sp.]MCS7067750.1 alpha-glucosidase/alpha-galactosidase [Meiothermus sp.]MDW8425609.1 alpha-glucosidase/alpha-galactosidase [Meiothermus sp.]